jgi:hypothetical protein
MAHPAFFGVCARVLPQLQCQLLCCGFYAYLIKDNMVGTKGRPKGSTDTVKRSRSCMTEAQKQIRRDRKNRKGNTTMDSFLMPPSNNNANNDSVEGEGESSMAGTDNDVAVTFSDNTNTSIRRAPRPVIANLEAEDEDDEGYDSDGEGGEGAEVMGTEKGIQQEYVQNIHQQLKDECNFQRGKQDDDWLVQYLKDNGWWIRKESAPRIAKKLSLPVYHYTYYRDVRVWCLDSRFAVWQRLYAFLSVL